MGEEGLQGKQASASTRRKMCHQIMTALSSQHSNADLCNCFFSIFSPFSIYYLNHDITDTPYEIYTQQWCKENGSTYLVGKYSEGGYVLEQEVTLKGHI